MGECEEAQEGNLMGVRGELESIDSVGAHIFVGGADFVGV